MSEINSKNSQIKAIISHELMPFIKFNPNSPFII